MDIKDILSQVSGNADLEKTLKNVKSPDDALKILKDAGIDVSMEDITGIVGKLGGMFGSKE